MSAESCGFCVGAIDNLEKSIEFQEEDKSEVLCSIVEAYGSIFGCGDDRLVCTVLMGIMEKYGKK